MTDNAATTTYNAATTTYNTTTTYTSDAIVLGAGLSGLVAAAEIADAGRQVLLIDREGENNIGGQAWWSFGGLFLVDSPEQRRLGVKDSLELARQDWFGSAQFDSDDDHWPRKWAEAYLDFAAGEKRQWLHDMGHRFFPVVGWAERGGSGADGHGNSVPRFHVSWGTGPGVVEPFERRVRAHMATGRIRFLGRHAAEELLTEHAADGTACVVGLRGSILGPDHSERGQESHRDVVGGVHCSR